MALEPAKLGDFQLEGELGAGSTARVYRATHRTRGEQVAIKMLGAQEASAEIRERFAREALLLATLSSRHVGRLLNFGFERGQPFLVLERLFGETLDEKLRRGGPVPLPLAVRWIEQLLIGVRDCHAAQVIHRDIKPSNVFLHREGDHESVRLIDFGVARLRDITGEPSDLTSAHHVLGSMGYMAPEQFLNAKGVGFSADLYAVGVVIFRMLTGRLPFIARSLETISRMKREQVAPLLSSIPGMPSSDLLDAHVSRAMARDPSARFQSAGEMLEDWWRVMASLDDDAPTDVRPRADLLGRPPVSAATVAEIPVILEAPLGALPTFSDVDNDDEMTTRQAPVDLPPDSARTPIALVAPSIGVLAGPPSEPDSDPFDVPTRTDPDLKRLVEKELELHRQRDVKE